MTPADDITELQARGIAAAAEVVARMTAELDGQTASGDRERDAPTASADPVGLQELRSAGARLIDLFAGLFEEGVEAYLELARSVAQAPAAAAASLSLRAAAGTRATTTVWIHNGAAHQASVTLSLTDLQAAGGARIEGSAARYLPAALQLDGGASGSSLLTIAVAPETPAGTYFAHVLVTGTPAAGLPLTLVVEPGPRG